MSITEKPTIEEVMDELYHYGTPRHSGRYPWGSGEEPYQHSGDFVSRVKELQDQGKSRVEIANYFGMTTTKFDLEYRAANEERRYLQIQQAKSLKSDGLSNYEIAKKMGLKNESTVRSILNPSQEAKFEETRKTKDFIKKQIEEKGYINVSTGVERELGISRQKLDTALYMLEMEGYPTYNKYVDQATNPGNQTTNKVICPMDTDFKTFAKIQAADIKPLNDYVSSDDGETFHPKFVYPKSMDSKRLEIVYAEDGGTKRDGMVEIRRGVEDLSLGKDRCSQVRILVDDTKYIKGMAVYGDDLPDGVDVRFYTNKSKSVSKLDVLKDIEKNAENPFGAAIKAEGGQYYYKDKDGNEQLGLINKRAAEGDWSDWTNALPSQFLSKQNKKLAERQLNIAIKEREDEYNDICNLTNPTVKKKMLEDYADGCDSAAVHLKAAALPRQQYHVILPVPEMKDNEIYAPNYEDGEKVALVRYPHAGTFEIPICTVNNKHPQAKNLIGNARDAVCINNKVAERLSGADFDGDTVMVIPTNDKVKITSTNELEGLKGFDPKLEYGTTEGPDGGRYNQYGMKIRVMKKGRETGLEMGKASNLITDMTIAGANTDEMARAVRHSMVVIDAAKHKLDWKRSEIENDIDGLKKKYQKKINPETGKVSYGGASTLLSSAKSPVKVNKRQGTPKINTPDKEWYDPNKPEGSLIYKDSDKAYYAERVKGKDGKSTVGYYLADGKGKVTFDPTNKEEWNYYKPVKRKNKETGEITFTNKDGKYQYKVKIKQEDVYKMSLTDDATTLISTYNTDMERLYANYANKMKSLANQARKEMISTGDIEYDKTAAATYKKEVDSLKYKLNEALKNSPRERTAQNLTDTEIKALVQDNPDLTKEQIAKRKAQALERNRAKVGAKRRLIDITDREWEAIQSGAVKKTHLKEILRYTDADVIKEKATPRAKSTVTPAQESKIKGLLASGRYTTKEIATACGVSVSTIYQYM